MSQIPRTGPLVTLPEYNDLSAEDLRAFRVLAFERFLHAGTCMSRTGSAVQGGWLVVSGEVERLLEYDGLGLAVDRVTAGGWINPACIIDSGLAGWTVVAATEVQAWLLTPDSYRRLMATPSRLARKIARQLARASIEDGHVAGQILARLQHATAAKGRPLAGDDLARLGFAKTMIGPVRDI